MLGSLEPLNHDPGHGEQFAMITLSHVRREDSTHLLRLDNIRMKVDSEGKATLKPRRIVREMIIDRPTHELIREVAGGEAAAESDVPDSPPRRSESDETPS